MAHAMKNDDFLQLFTFLLQQTVYFISSHRLSSSTNILS